MDHHHHGHGRTILPTRVGPEVMLGRTLGEYSLAVDGCEEQRVYEKMAVVVG